MSQNSSIENNKDSNSSDNDSSLEYIDKSDEDTLECEILANESEDYCFDCAKKEKCCWCVDKKEDWDNNLRRFRGYDYYCLECLEMDKRYYEEEIENVEKKINNEKDKNKIEEYKKWKKEYEERLESTNEEVDTAKKYLNTGELYEYHCLKCDYVHYGKPLDIIFWICEVCNKKNYLFKPENFEAKGYYYYDENEEIKYTKNFESLKKMNKRKYSNEHYYYQDDMYFYTDGIKYNHPHDPHNCLDCSYSFSEKNCPVCNKKLRRRRYRDYLINNLR